MRNYPFNLGLPVFATLLGLVGSVHSGCGHGIQLHIPLPSPPRVKPLLQEAARRLHHAGDLHGARTLAEQALELDPHLARAHLILAQLKLLEGDPAAAFPHWMAALADGRSNHTAVCLDLFPISWLGRNQLHQLERLLLQISTEHPSSQSRSEALSYLIQIQLRLGQQRAARASLKKRTLVKIWQGIGGFDNQEGKGFDTPYNPERQIDLNARYPGQRGQVSWRPIEHHGSEPYLELDEFFFPFTWNVAYLFTTLRSTAESDLVLEVATTSPIKVWLNERSILAAREVRTMRHRQFRIPIRLRRGFNKLLVKSCHRKGPWRMAVWFTRTAGSPLSLPASLFPRRIPRDSRSPEPWKPSMALPASIDSMEAGPVKDFWTAVMLGTAGLRVSSMSALARYLDRHPRDPVALLFSARLLINEKQLQRASLLLNAGQSLPGPYSAAFWNEAARLYRLRGQHDKAFSALDRSLAASPNNVMALKELEALLARKGWHQDRCRLARKVRARYPDWHWPPMILASCNESLGRPRRANRWLQSAVQLDSFNQHFRDQLVGSHLSLGQCQRAISLQRLTTKIWPHRAGPLLDLGKVLKRCGRLEAALSALDRSRRRIPDWHRPYELMGEILYEQGKMEEAVRRWEVALRYNPDHVQLWDRVTHLKPDRDPVLEAFTPAEAQIDRALARAKTATPAEGASIIWLLDHEVSHLLPDGTLKRVVTTIRQAVDRAGRDALGQASLPRAGLVKVLEAFSVDSQGQRREVTSMHGRTVRYPTLEEGAVVVLQYRHLMRPHGYLRHHLANTWLFQHSLEQVMNAQWILALPPERKLSLHIQGSVTHEIAQRFGLKIHTFSARNIPPLHPEPASFPVRDLIAAVTVSTVPSWNYFSEWSRSLTSEVFAMDPQLNRALDRITSGKTSIEEKIRAVYHHALTRIRYQQDYETFIAGVKPHTASAVLTRGYGDCKDKSVLIIAMLRHLGIKANLALVRTLDAGKVQPDIPSQQFNHAVVYLPPQPGVPGGRFLDATAENQDIDVLREDIQGTHALVLFKNDHQMIRIPFQEPEKNRTVIDATIKLESDGSAKIKLDIMNKGGMAGRLRKALQNSQILRQYAQSVIHNLYPDCSLDDFNVDGHRSILQPLSLSVSTTCSTAARAEQDQLRLPVPKMLSRITSTARWTERKHPLYFGPPGVIRTELKLQLPPRMRVHNRPQPIDIRNPCFTASGQWQDTDSGLRYSHVFRRTCTQLEPDRYPSFRAAMTQLKVHLEKEVVLAPEVNKTPRSSPKGRMLKKRK